jgi:hypothetical protein
MNGNEQCRAIQICPIPTQSVEGKYPDINLKLSYVQPNAKPTDPSCNVITMCDSMITPNMPPTIMPTQTKFSPSSTKMAPSMTKMAPSSTKMAPSMTKMAPSSTKFSPSSTIPINTPFAMSTTRSGCGNSKMFPCQLYSAPSATVCPGSTISVDMQTSSGTAQCIATPPSSSIPTCNSTQRVVKKNGILDCVDKTAI